MLRTLNLVCACHFYDITLNPVSAEIFDDASFFTIKDNADKKISVSYVYPESFSVAHDIANGFSLHSNILSIIIGSLLEKLPQRDNFQGKRFIGQQQETQKNQYIFYFHSFYLPLSTFHY